MYFTTPKFLLFWTLLEWDSNVKQISKICNVWTCLFGHYSFETFRGGDFLACIEKSMTKENKWTKQVLSSKKQRSEQNVGSDKEFCLKGLALVMTHAFRTTLLNTYTIKDTCKLLTSLWCWRMSHERKNTSDLFQCLFIEWNLPMSFKTISR